MLPTLFTVLILAVAALLALEPSTDTRRVAPPRIAAPPAGQEPTQPGEVLVLMLVDSPADARLLLDLDASRGGFSDAPAPARNVLLLDASAGESQALETLRELALLEIPVDFVDLRLFPAED